MADEYFVFGNMVVGKLDQFIVKIDLRHESKVKEHDVSGYFLDIEFILGRTSIKKEIGLTLLNIGYGPLTKRKGLHGKLESYGLSDKEKEIITGYFYSVLLTDNNIREEDIVDRICTLKGEEYKA